METLKENEAHNLLEMPKTVRSNNEQVTQVCKSFSVLKIFSLIDFINSGIRHYFGIHLLHRIHDKI